MTGPVDPRLWHASASMRRFLVATTVCGMLIAACTLASAVVLAGLVARVITDPAERHLGRMSVSLGILLLLWAIRTAMQWRQGTLAQRGASGVIADLSHQVLNTTATLPPRRLAERRDEAAALVTRGLDGMRPYFTSYLPALFLAAILTPAAVVVIAVFDWQSALIVLVALPLIPVFMVLIGLATRDRTASALAAMTTLQSRMLDLISGLPTLRAVRRVGGSIAHIRELGARHRRSTMATLRVAFLSSLVMELLATLGVALVAVSVGLRLVSGEMTLAAGLTALLLAPEVFWPLRRVGVAFHAAQDGKIAAENAFRLIAPEPDPESLGPDIVAVPGQVTVITGPNGAGKTTALHHLLGLDAARPDDDRRSWWRQVAWLPHRPAIVPGTVQQNLELFGPLENLEDACRAACFDEVIDQLPNGLHTVLGRDGVGLSLGQRQRLGLARAFGSAASVLLLDEPTAHLDAPTEHKVLRAITRRAADGAAVVVVGHRDPVLAIADRVVHVGSLVDA
jgi:ATP-binding cassette subfamily C protein CydD